MPGNWFKGIIILTLRYLTMLNNLMLLNISPIASDLQFLIAQRFKNSYFQ